MPSPCEAATWTWTGATCIYHHCISHLSCPRDTTGFESRNVHSIGQHIGRAASISLGNVSVWRLVWVDALASYSESFYVRILLVLSPYFAYVVVR